MEDADPAAEKRAEVIRDSMDSLWWKMTEEQREAMRAMSIKLYEDEPPSLDPLDRE